MTTVRERRLTSRFAGVFLPGARLREVAVVIFYIPIGGTVAELAGNGWTARGGPGRLFFDDTFVLVTVVAFDHRWSGMTRADAPLYDTSPLLPVSGRFGVDTNAHAIELAARFRGFRGLRVTLNE